MSLDEPLAPAAALIRRLEPELMANVFRWTGHFPERTRVLLRYLAERAGAAAAGLRADAGDRGHRGAHDAGDRAGDELRAAGVVPAVRQRAAVSATARSLTALRYRRFLSNRSDARFTIRSISRG